MPERKVRSVSLHLLNRVLTYVADGRRLQLHGLTSFSTLYGHIFILLLVLRNVRSSLLARDLRSDQSVAAECATSW